MLSEGSDPGNPPKQTFELNFKKKYKIICGEYGLVAGYLAVAVPKVFRLQWRRIAGGRVPKCPPVKNAGRQNGRFAPQIVAARIGQLPPQNNFRKQVREPLSYQV